MKTLLIMRHGKAEDDSPDGDKGRRLTPKGERDAAFIGGRMAARFGGPDWVVASDAVRARQTAEIAANARRISARSFLTRRSTRRSWTTCWASSGDCRMARIARCSSATIPDWRR